MLNRIQSTLPEQVDNISNQLACLRGLTTIGIQITGTLNYRGVETIKASVVTTRPGEANSDAGEATNEAIWADNYATGNRMLCTPTNVTANNATLLDTQCS